MIDLDVEITMRLVGVFFCSFITNMETAVVYVSVHYIIFLILVFVVQFFDNEKIMLMLEKGKEPGAFKVQFKSSIVRRFEFHSKCQNKKFYTCVGKFNFDIKCVYFILRIESERHFSSAISPTNIFS